jgi:Zn-dependent alcohol dehydrogenase
MTTDHDVNVERGKLEAHIKGCSICSEPKSDLCEEGQKLLENVCITDIKRKFSENNIPWLEQ